MRANPQASPLRVSFVTFVLILVLVIILIVLVASPAAGIHCTRYLS
jgi:hypothetical protein